MFSELSAPIPDLNKTLERIGCSNLVIKHNLETLDTLIRGYATHIPFENLMVSYEHILPSLAITDLYDKIVTRKRGGYCFEMNGFFWALLRDLGFDVYSVSVYVLENCDQRGDLGHRSNIVTIDGVKYFVEVGFGGNSAALYGVPIDGHIRGDFFVKYDEKKREYTLYKIVDARKEKEQGYERFLERQEVDGTEVICKKIQMFRDFIAYPEEFYLPNKGVFHSPENPMNSTPICNIITPKGETFTLQGDEIRIKTNTGKTIRKLKDDTEFREFINKYFGIVI